MSRRFSDGPINLIHRIPTPEQLASARPAKRSFGQAIIDTVTRYVRSAVDTIAGSIRKDFSSPSTVLVGSAPEERLDKFAGEPSRDRLALSEPGANKPEMVGQSMESAAPSPVRQEVEAPPPASTPALVQPDEVAELRAYLLRQEQDIARLSARIQELKSLVVSQQQVLVYLGKELESGSVSPLMGGVTSAASKRNRPVRQKPMMKGKAGARQEDDPKRSSLGLWPASTRRPDL